MSANGRVRAEKRAPFSLGLHLFQLLLLVHGNARADYGLDLARQDAIQREV